jgi:TolB-like protein
MDDSFAADLEDVFAEAAALEPAQRASLLDARCAGRPELRREVESLLASHDELGSFLHVGTAVGSSDPWPEGHGRARVGHIIGHYRLVERVALGSMGAVYRATDLALGRDAAIKLLPPAFDVEVRQSVLAEAEASARLQHPAIATFYEAGEADGETYIAMELVPGPTLRARLRSGPLNVADALALARCLLEALAHAHAAGLLHRDIKPENIVVVGQGFAKLLDFGIAVPLTSRDVPRAGTIGYLAPEQVAGAPLDARTDVFQVGVVLYEMLTGRPLFGGESRLQRLASGMTAPDLTALDASVPEAVAAMVRRATSHDPDARYDSAAAFLRAIRAADAGPHPAMAARVVAVADFDNRTGSEGLAWVASAVADGIHTELSRVQHLNVMSRRRFARDLAQSGGTEIDPVATSLRLGCGWLVRGEVGELSGGLQVTARLVEVATGATQHSCEERGPLEALLTLQRRLAATLAGELSAPP